MVIGTHLDVRVQSTVSEAPGITSYDLRPVEGSELPPFTAGAHIDLTLPGGIIRSYSLINRQSERHRYVIAVQKDRASRGGSAWLHDHLRTGDVLTVSAPRNNFALDESAARSILIAGGIGITPLLGMADRLAELDRDWRLVYCSRKKSNTAFIEHLTSYGARVSYNFDEEPGGTLLDIAGLVRDAPGDAHLYCCGPLPMLSAFESATAGLARQRVHMEYFTAKEAPDVGGGFTVVLASRRLEVVVPAGKTILDALLDAGIDVPYSCKEGVCGTCETKVLEGTPDHRDLILTDEEQAAGKVMMICCSGSKSARLVLEL